MRVNRRCRLPLANIFSLAARRQMKADDGHRRCSVGIDREFARLTRNSRMSGVLSGCYDRGLSAHRIATVECALQEGKRRETMDANELE